MNRDEAEAWASLQWCQDNGREPISFLSDVGAKIGYTDGEFNYWMGHGPTLESAIADAASRKDW